MQYQNPQDLADLTVQTDQPFEYEEKLAVLVHRQQEITDALNLTKNQAPTHLEAESPTDSSPSEMDEDTLKEGCNEEWL